jgi:hypothetical protein
MSALLAQGVPRASQLTRVVSLSALPDPDELCWLRLDDLV